MKISLFNKNRDIAGKPGGDVFFETRRKQNLLYIIYGVIAFIILNLILYYVTVF